MAKFEIAIVEAQDYAFQELRTLLQAKDFELERFREQDLAVVERLGSACLCIIGADRADPWRSIALLQRLTLSRPDLRTILLAWKSSEELAIAALRAKATDYFAPPIRLRDVASRIRATASAFLPAPAPVANPVAPKSECPPIVGESHAMREVRSYLLRLAQRDCNSLLLGETGTGKDLVAQAIHANSPRRNRPFVCVNCAAIPDTLLESELFGYERGAFTGANVRTAGKIEQAQGGTIFFDEIGEMTPYAQAKILRVIEDRQIQRLGGRGSVPVNVRVLSATNQNLPKLISQHRFRKDLYFRLNVACIRVPALRERREDIADLSRHYVEVFNRETGCVVEGFAQEAVEYLQNYDWPGNVRELKNFIESVFVDPPRGTIDLDCVMRASNRLSSGASCPAEKEQLLEALAEAQGNKSKAAERLHWSRMTIYRKIAKYKLQSSDDRYSVAGAGAG
jgi:DNA-binding NtrC family response regulator